ncbi:MAG TPA: GNAT family N-acetyltransferase [Gaiellaceae bacterium]|nr:GNAT family N-acetyltransferase [Gaiellaceae bacterium]
MSDLSDDRITLRPWALADAEAIAEAFDGDPEIARWLDNVPQPYTVDDARAWLTSTTEQAYGVFDRDSGELLGGVGIRWNESRDVAEVGYWTHRRARGRGVMTRAVAIVSRLALEREGAARVQLRADPENVASCRVAEKVGFTLEGVLRSAHWNARLGRRQDHRLYSLLRDEVERLPTWR